MSDTFVAPIRRVTPVAAALVAAALLAAVALGFALRAWTERTPKPTSPAIAHVQPATTPASPMYACRLGRAC
jgi:sugar (pentulose or hexulose) kinase